MGKYIQIQITPESAKAKVEELGSYRKAAEFFKISKSKLHRLATKTGSIKKASSIRRFVITTAINDTPVHLPFYNSLMGYCKRNNAELLVYRHKYRNPTSPFESLKGDPRWADEIMPFSIDTKRKLSDKLEVLIANIVPTATDPLVGLESNTGQNSCIIPHPKQQLKSIPVFKGDDNKLALSTGAITVSNYSKSRAGEKGEFHHIIGAVVAEIEDDGSFHVRHISADKDGSFYDIAGNEMLLYTPSGAKEPIDGSPAVVFGDIHCPFEDKIDLQASLDLAKMVRAKIVVGHDVFDCFYGSKHEMGNPFQDYGRHVFDMVEVEKEIESAANTIRHIANYGDWDFIVARGNHDDHLEHWLAKADQKNLGINLKYYHYLSYHKYNSICRTESGFSYHNSLEFAISKKVDLQKNRIRFLKVDESLRVKGIELGAHGDRSANGARGSLVGFSKLATKSIFGHSHSPGIRNGAMQVGMIGRKDLSYAKGPSSWMSTNAVIYPNGKRTLVNIIKGKYCL